MPRRALLILLLLVLAAPARGEIRIGRLRLENHPEGGALSLLWLPGGDDE